MAERGLRRGIWNGLNASLRETRPRGPVSPRPGMGMKGRAIPAIPMVFESEWKIAANGGTVRNGTVRMRVSDRLPQCACEGV